MTELDDRKMRQGRKSKSSTKGMLERMEARLNAIESENNTKKQTVMEEDLANFRFVLQNLQAMGQKLNQANGYAQQATDMYNAHVQLIERFLTDKGLFEEYKTFVEDESRPPIEVPEAAAEEEVAETV